MGGSLFVDFLQYSIGSKDKMEHIPSDKEWYALYSLCLKQSIIGVGFEGVSRLSKEGYKPPFNILMEWIAISEQIKSANKHINTIIVDLFYEFKYDGFDSCLLKGQGNNLLYPSCYTRTPGDIDLWITPKGKGLSKEQRKSFTLGFLRKKYPKGVLHYNHIDGGIYKNVKVEVHHRPRFHGS